MRRDLVGRSGVGGLAALLAVHVACGGGDEVAVGNVEGIDRLMEPLLDAEIDSIDGTYGAGCTDRTGTWTEPVGAAGGTLTVVLNDPDCTLTLTAVNTTGVVTPDAPLLADPSIALGLAFSLAASEFAGTELEFYANARSSTVTFDGPFTITLLYSDDSTLATATNTAEFEVAVSSVTAQSVPAPEYTLSVTGLDTLTDVDDVVVSATGTAELTLPALAQAGQGYVVLEDSGLTTYEEIDLAYDAGDEVVFAASIPAVEFTLVNEDLTGSTVVRTLIISNLQNGVRSYQVFAITFAPPVLL